MSRPVVYSDIDFNRHVNTLRYVDLIFDTMPLELIEKNKGLRFDIHFLAEAIYGDTLTVGNVTCLIDSSILFFQIPTLYKMARNLSMPPCICLIYYLMILFSAFSLTVTA